MASATPDPRQGVGRHGERLAEAALRRAGLRIVERRFRSRHGEIDLVAELGELLVFVEVKTRRGTGYGMPAEAVTAAKRRHMVRAAEAYLQRRRCHDRACRFDVVEVHLGPDDAARIEHIEDAFRLTPTG